MWLVPIAGVAPLVVVWAWARRVAQRVPADAPDVSVAMARGKAGTVGLCTVVAATVGLPLHVLAVAEVPKAVIVLAAVPYLVLAVLVNNTLARDVPTLMLPTLRWPDELRTLRTPAGRVALGIGAILLVTLVLSSIRGGSAPVTGP